MGLAGAAGSRARTHARLAGVPLDQISQLVGHKGTTVAEVVYRHQLRPVLQTGARVMDSLFTRPNGAAETSGVTQIVTQS